MGSLQSSILSFLPLFPNCSISIGTQSSFDEWKSSYEQKQLEQVKIITKSSFYYINHDDKLLEEILQRFSRYQKVLCSFGHRQIFTLKNRLITAIIQKNQQQNKPKSFLIQKPIDDGGDLQAPNNIFVYKYLLMDIGSAIAVFLVLSLLMLALFCFVTKYFHYKLKRTIEETNEVYSMVDQVYQHSEEEVEGEFEEYKGKSRSNRAKPEYKGDDDEMYIEMTDLKAPLKRNQDDLYKPSVLRSKLNGESFQPISKQESSRDISELKSFRPEKLNTTNRTSRSSKGKEGSSTKHTFINRLVCYNENGLTICDVNVKMIRKVSEGVVKESKTCKTQHFSSSEESFEDQLEIIGFQRNVYGFYKYETSVEVSNMKTDENYLVKSLKTSESKQQISEEEYNRHFNELAPATKINQ